MPGYIGGVGKSISLGNAHSAVAGRDKDILMVGDNSRGQIGDGTLVNRTRLLKAGCPPPGSPSAPLAVTAVAGDSLATLSWQSPTSPGSSAIQSYVVTSSNQLKVEVVSTDGNPPPTQVVFPGLTNGESYTFTVKARNSIGIGYPSLPSSSVTPMGPEPTPPRFVTAVGGASAATVSWTLPWHTGASPLSSYTVRATPGGNTVVVTGSPPATSTTVSGLVNGTSYTFTVQAANDHGESPLSSPSNSVVPLSPPDPPVSVTAVAGDGTATVRWIPSEANGSSPVSSFRITASPGGQSMTVKCGSSRSVTMYGLANGTPYTFAVEAGNTAGTSEPSFSSAVIPGSSPVRGFYSSGSNIHFGDPRAPIPASDPIVALRGVNVEWLDYDLRSTPIAEQQSGLYNYLGHWDNWPDVNGDCTPFTDSSIQAMDDWGANVVRVMLSEMFWGDESATGSSPCASRFPTYRQNVDAVVASITSRGMIALIDLHTNQRFPCSSEWNAQREMAGISALDFWESIVERYGANPKVAFNLYNEPKTRSLNFLGSNSGDTDDVRAQKVRQAWDLWLNGGAAQSCPRAPDPQRDGTNPCPGGDGVSWTVAGHQTMYDRIRATEDGLGFVRHLIFVDGNTWSRDVPPVTHMIKDGDGSLADNLVYAVHHYTVYGNPPVPDCAPSAQYPAGCLTTWSKFSKDNSVPVNVSEFGWNNGPEYDLYNPTFPKTSGQQQNENMICTATNARFGWIAYRWSSDRDHLSNVQQYYGILRSNDQRLPSFEPNASGIPVQDALTFDPTTAEGRQAQGARLGCYVAP